MQPFVIPDEIRAGWDAKAKGRAAEQAWKQRFAAYRAAHPELAAEFERRMRGELPADWRARLDDVHRGDRRKAGGDRDAVFVAAGAERARRRRSPRCSAARRT